MTPLAPKHNSPTENYLKNICSFLSQHLFSCSVFAKKWFAIISIGITLAFFFSMKPAFASKEPDIFIEFDPSNPQVNGQAVERLEIQDGSSGVWKYEGEDGKAFYFKQTHNILIERYDSVLMSLLLNLIYQGTEKRFPTLKFAVNKGEIIGVLSEELTGFKTIKEVHKECSKNKTCIRDNPFYGDQDLRDLAHYYIPLLFFGGGDPNPGNIVFRVDGAQLLPAKAGRLDNACKAD